MRTHLIYYINERVLVALDPLLARRIELSRGDGESPRGSGMERQLDGHRPRLDRKGNNLQISWKWKSTRVSRRRRSRVQAEGVWGKRRRSRPISVRPRGTVNPEYLGGGGVMSRADYEAQYRYVPGVKRPRVPFPSARGEGG